MFSFVLKKMLKNKWLVICLLLGGTLSVAVMVSIPLFTDAVLENALQSDLIDYNNTNNVDPSLLIVKCSKPLEDEEENNNFYEFYEESVEKNKIIKNKIGIEPIKENESYSTGVGVIMRDINADYKKFNLVGSSINMSTITSNHLIADYAKIVEGSWPKEQKNFKEDEVLEVAMNYSTAMQYNLTVGSTYKFAVMGSGRGKWVGSMLIKLVCTYNISEEYYMHFRQMEKGDSTQSFVANYNTIKSAVKNKTNLFLTNVSWFYKYNPKDIKVRDVGKIIDTIKSTKEELFRYQLEMNGITVLEKYQLKSKTLQNTLWILQVPIIIMLLFYIFMVSGLILKYEKNEISIFSSRGSPKRKIVLVYFWQSFILALLSGFLGVFLSILFCGITGSTTGFLEFVNRKPLEIVFSYAAFFVTILTIVIFTIIMLLPVIFSRNYSIVKQKQNKMGGKSKSFWEIMFLDVILVGLSVYGLYNFNNRQDMLKVTGAVADEIPIDPLLFVISMAFIFGCALFSVRIISLLNKLLFLIFKRFLNTPLYIACASISRAKTKDQFLLVFIIVALGIGLYNSTAANTLNINRNDKINYENGADLIVKENFNQVVDYNLDSEYIEPNINRYDNVLGIENLSKVIQRDNIKVDINSKTISNVNGLLMQPDKFAEVTFKRDDLYAPYHFYDYMNYLTKYPHSVILSNSLMKKLGLKAGDTVNVTIPDYVTPKLRENQGHYGPPGKDNVLTMAVIGGVDYFPTYKLEFHSGVQKDLIVMNYDYVINFMRFQPYSVFIKKSAEVTSAELIADLKTNKINPTYYHNTVYELLKAGNDSLVQGTNGYLTIAFIIIMILTLMGSLIYWVLLIKERQLQYGIIRSLGLFKWELNGIIIFEQLVLYFGALIAGSITGFFASGLFVPLLNLKTNAADQMPKFIVVASMVDYLRIYAIIGVIILFCAVILGFILSRMNISQTLKLGED